MADNRNNNTNNRRNSAGNSTETKGIIAAGSSLTDYRRILSYLYRYENANRKSCCGFIKAEQKSGNLKLTVQIDDNRLLSGMTLKLYFYEVQNENPENENFKTWHLHNLTAASDQKEWQLFLLENELPAGFSIRKQSGVVLFYQESYYYGSVWIGEEIPQGIFSPRHDQEVKEQKLSPENMPESGNESEDELEEKNELKPEDEPEPEAEPEVKSEPEARPEAEPEVKSEPKSESKPEAEVIAVPEPLTEEPLVKSCESENSAVDRLEKMWINSAEQKQPVDNIFNPAFYKGYKISVGQLKEMGEEAAAFSENQFLLKGYQRYHHLLAGKVRFGGEDRYCMGVPGIYENREKYMAEIYRFPIFLSLTENRIKTGGFGYWLHILSEE